LATDHFEEVRWIQQIDTNGLAAYTSNHTKRLSELVMTIICSNQLQCKFFNFLFLRESLQRIYTNKEDLPEHEAADVIAKSLSLFIFSKTCTFSRNSSTWGFAISLLRHNSAFSHAYKAKSQQ
jgi:hypothetical protein